MVELNIREGDKKMNENLIPPAVVDLGTKYIAATDINEKTNLEVRIDDTIKYLEAIRNVKKGRQGGFKRTTDDRATDIKNYVGKRTETWRDLTGRGGLG
jgi:hypothetical protein